MVEIWKNHYIKQCRIYAATGINMIYIMEYNSFFILLEKNNFLRIYFTLKNIEAKCNAVCFAVNVAIIMTRNTALLMQRFKCQKSFFEYILHYPSKPGIMKYVQNFQASIQIRQVQVLWWRLSQFLLGNMTRNISLCGGIF